MDKLASKWRIIMQQITQWACILGLCQSAHNGRHVAEYRQVHSCLIVKMQIDAEQYSELQS